MPTQLRAVTQEWLLNLWRETVEIALGPVKECELLPPELEGP